jgi:NTE family protein
MNLMWFFNKRKKVGLVLGSGGARGLAHVGVIKTLLKHKIPIDLIVGSSVGAFIGGMFASSGKIDELEKMVMEVTHKDIAKVLFDPTWGGGLVKGEKTLEFFKKLFSDKKFEDLIMPFFAVATDLYTAKQVVISEGDVATAVRASISVPLIYSPVMYAGHLLVDGGVSCPVPVEIAKENGAEVVIAVNLDGVYFSGHDNKDFSSSSTVDVLKDSYFALRYNLANKEVKEADIVIEPEMKYIEDFDFVGGKAAVEAGERATEKQMARVKKLL